MRQRVAYGSQPWLFPPSPVWFFPPERRWWFAIAMSWSFPLANALMVGQDIGIVLLIGLAAARLFTAGREFTAGLVASLLGIKPVYSPHGRSDVSGEIAEALGDFLIGVAVQTALSFTAGGIGWPREYLAVLWNPLVDPDPARMLSLRAVSLGLSLPAAFWIAGAVALYGGFWFFCRRMPFRECAITALAVSLIASPHSRASATASS